MSSGLARARELEHVRLFSFETNDLKLCGHRGARRHGHLCACEDRRRDGVRLQSGQHTKHDERVGGGLARGIELAVWRVWAQTGREVGHDWVRPFLVAKVEFDKLLLDASEGIELFVERDP